jgi:hypothetical protein
VRPATEAGLKRSPEYTLGKYIFETASRAALLSIRICWLSASVQYLSAAVVALAQRNSLFPVLNLLAGSSLPR